jgi:hypothetical protein
VTASTWSLLRGCLHPITHVMMWCDYAHVG